MVPTDELPPVVPLTCQVTAVFVLVVEFARFTTAVKSACVLMPTETAVGVIAIEVMLVLLLPPLPPQPERPTIPTRNARRKRTDLPFGIKVHLTGGRVSRATRASASFLLIPLN